jgi:DNA invertase Pin-like site-specific DNA recombinase
MRKSKRVALYVRVSTSGQTTENQLRALRSIAKHQGWQIVETFKDEGISGAKGREDRPAFDAMCKGITRRDFDLIASWSVDRLGRSLTDLLGFLGEVHAKGVDLYLHQQGLDTTTPAGRAMFQMMGVFAEFEREMIRERVKAGLQRAVDQGKKLGRPGVAPAVAQKVREARAAGDSVRTIAGALGVSVGLVHRLVATA